MKTMIELPAELERALHEIAQQTGKPESEVIQEALAIYISGVRRSRLRSLGAGEDDELRGSETEDWLTQTWRPLFAG